MSVPEPVTAVILAGGRSRRMGGEDKGLLPLAGRPLAARVIAAVAPQVDRVLVNANGRLDEYAALGQPVVQDGLPDHPGPLAGILAALEAVEGGLLLVVPCDTPRLPADLVARMQAALTASDAEVCTVHDGERLHQVVLLLRPTVAPDLRAYLEDGGHRVETWLRARAFAVADFSDRPGAFANVNTPEELRRMEAELGAD